MRAKTIKCRHNPNLSVDATVDVFTGRPLVEITHDDCPLIDSIALTPIESERLGKALIWAAHAARAKLTETEVGS